MSYKKWFKEHAQKHSAIMRSLTHLNHAEVIEYFDFDNMRVKHPDFCPLYEQNKKCHHMEKLNCYLCACMHFRFDDNGINIKNGKTCYSYCSIDSKNHKLFKDDKSIHNDCSACKVPHKHHVIEKYFDRDWSVVMKECNLTRCNRN